MSKTKTTQAIVFSTLKSVFHEGPWVLLPQVRNKTGLSTKEEVRYADAIAASVYPSRGLYLVGIEIKVSRNDWIKELRNPVKSTAIQKFCRHWYIAAPGGVIEKNELPATWGLITCTTTRAKIAVKAPTLDTATPDMSFLCSVLRNAMKGVVPKSETKVSSALLNDARREGIEEGRKLERDHGKNHALATQVGGFEQASGVRISNWNYGNIGNAVRAVLSMSAACDKKRIVRREINNQINILDSASGRLRESLVLLDSE